MDTTPSALNPPNFPRPDRLGEGTVLHPFISVKSGFTPWHWEIHRRSFQATGTAMTPTLEPHHIMKTRHLKHAIIAITIAASTPALVAEETPTETPKAVENEMVQPGSLTAIISDSATFSTLSKALEAAGLDMVLGNKGEFTIFAPTDEAFGKLDAEVLTKLMLPENKEKLRSLLLYHVVAGRMMAADLQEGDLKTMNGEKIKLDVKSDEIEVDGEKVFSSDVQANNGVMHSLGVVLVPKGLDGFAGLDK